MAKPNIKTIENEIKLIEGIPLLIGLELMLVTNREVKYILAQRRKNNFRLKVFNDNKEIKERPITFNTDINNT